MSKPKLSIKQLEQTMKKHYEQEANQEKQMKVEAVTPEVTMETVKAQLTEQLTNMSDVEKLTVANTIIKEASNMKEALIKKAEESGAVLEIHEDGTITETVVNKDNKPVVEVVDWATALTGALTGATQAIVSTLTTIATTVVSTITTVVSSLASLLMGVFSNLTTSITSTVGSMSKTLSKI